MVIQDAYYPCPARLWGECSSIFVHFMTHYVSFADLPARGGKSQPWAAYTHEFNRIIRTLQKQGTSLPMIVQKTILLKGLTSQYEQIKNILNTANWLTIDEDQ